MIGLTQRVPTCRRPTDVEWATLLRKINEYKCLNGCTSHDLASQATIAPRFISYINFFLTSNPGPYTLPNPKQRPIQTCQPLEFKNCIL